jgi:hypothetical protein
MLARRIYDFREPNSPINDICASRSYDISRQPSVGSLIAPKGKGRRKKKEKAEEKGDESRRWRIIDIADFRVSWICRRLGARRAGNEFPCKRALRSSPRGGIFPHNPIHGHYGT